MYLSIVIPAYNEKDHISEVLEELCSVCSKSEKVTDFEIIVIDDHSSDNMFDTIQQINNEKISCIRLSRKCGSHRAIRAGLNNCKGEVVLCISGDGQEDPVILTEMIDKIDEGHHIVWGVRKQRDEPMLSRIFTFFFYKLLNMFVAHDNKHIDLSKADFYMLSRRVVDAINSCKESNTSLFGLLVWIGFNQDFVEYERRERISGKSKWSFRSKMRLAKDWIIAFSGIPLKIITVVGLVVALIGIIYALFIFIYALSGKTTPGWAETIILILIIGGFQMTLLGVMGEYLWRNFDETRKRPLYFVEDTTLKKNEK